MWISLAVWLHSNCIESPVVFLPVTPRSGLRLTVIGADDRAVDLAFQMAESALILSR